MKKIFLAISILFLMASCSFEKENKAMEREFTDKFKTNFDTELIGVWKLFEYSEDPVNKYYYIYSDKGERFIVDNLKYNDKDEISSFEKSNGADERLYYVKDNKIHTLREYWAKRHIYTIDIYPYQIKNDTLFYDYGDGYSPRLAKMKSSL